jgi:adenine phosphoribosyltransferase
VAAIESRGFLFGAPLAMHLGVGFAPIRKPGKLPHQTHRVDYALEYGTDSLEAHVDAFLPDERVLLVDDVLATGGTAAGAVRLVHDLGADVVATAFVIELSFLGGRARLGHLPVHTIVQY